MAIFVIGDLHLSLGADKPMDKFPGWQGYVQRIRENWLRLVTPGDTVVLAGDTSWGMKLEEAAPDFEFLEQLPGQKLLLKGNHDYWWTTARKMETYFEEQGFHSLHLLHNNAYHVEGLALCGTRSWLFEPDEPHDEKVMNRELGRLRASLQAAGDSGEEKIVFLHYPPVYPGRLLSSGHRSDAGVWGQTLLLWPPARRLGARGSAGRGGRAGIPPDFGRCAALLPHKI